MKNDIEILRNKESRLIDGEVSRFYDHLCKNVISCKDNIDQLRERTKEIYYEIISDSNFSKQEDGLILVEYPSVDDIAEKIDSENIDSIYIYCCETGFPISTADEIAGFYSHDFGCTLDIIVEEILWEYGLSLRKKIKSSRCVYNCNISPYQMYLIKDWM